MALAPAVRNHVSDSEGIPAGAAAEVLQLEKSAALPVCGLLEDPTPAAGVDHDDYW